MMSSRGWFWVLVAIAIAGGVTLAALPRGIRNNNPGNLRRTTDKWLGLAAEQTDPEYFQFERPEFGLRAMGVVLLNYAERHKLNTVRAIVARYAPAHENPTDSYIANVAARLRVGPDEPFDVRARLLALMRAMVIQENGAAAAALHVTPPLYDAAFVLIGARA